MPRKNRTYRKRRGGFFPGYTRSDSSMQGMNQGMGNQGMSNQGMSNQGMGSQGMGQSMNNTSSNAYNGMRNMGSRSYRGMKHVGSTMYRNLPSSQMVTASLLGHGGKTRRRRNKKGSKRNKY